MASLALTGAKDASLLLKPATTASVPLAFPDRPSGPSEPGGIRVTWYATDLAQFRSERVGLDTLAHPSDWFVIIGWRMDDKIRLVLDAEIIAGGRTYPIFLQYPQLFPYTPPSVFSEETLRGGHSTNLGLAANSV